MDSETLIIDSAAGPAAADTEPETQIIDSAEAPPPPPPPAAADTESETQIIDPKSNPNPEDTSSKRKRRSRWEATPADDNTTVKKRKSRWADEEPAFQLPDFMKDFTLDSDPEVQALNARLMEISRILQSGQQLDDRAAENRSPSPDPVYDNIGTRINTREYRARERLNKERQDIISLILKRNPNFKPPSDYRPPKLHKKLYIPMKEYPGYNFIGLIIGPRGNTQKRMEKETGAKIVIRGKGSVKEGRFGGQKQQRASDYKYDPSENEDLHVLVEAETQEGLDAAAGMVEKLLHPVDEGLNEHKRQQLRELAALNGTIRDDEFCRLCGEPGHRQFACPSRMSTFKSDVLCKICGDGGHPTIDCPVKGTHAGKKMDDEYQNFLAELGGSLPEGVTRNTNTPLPITNGNNNDANPPPWSSSSAHPGLGSASSKMMMMPGGIGMLGKEIDDTNLYIGYLPPTMEDDTLIRLFSPFGEIVMAKVIKDRITGLSKGYGFVKYSDISQANQAIASMNGYRVDGRVIAVRVAGKPPPPTLPPAPTNYPGGYPSQMAPPPPGSYPPPPPWGPPPPSYAPRPPPPGYSPSSYPVAGQHYGVQYPPPPPHHNTNMTSATTDTYPPPPGGLHSQNTQSPSMSGTIPNNQTAYPSAYASYYNVPPPPASHSLVADQQNFQTAPWSSNPPAPPADQTTTYGTDPEYEKFMAEMK